MPELKPREVLGAILEGSPIPTFVIDENHVVTHWNRALEFVSGVPAATMIGSSDSWKPFYPESRPVMADLILDHASAGSLGEYYGNKRIRPSPIIPGAYEAEDFFPDFADGGAWLYFTAAPLRLPDGRVIGAVETLQVTTERKLAEEELKRHRENLEQLVLSRTAELEARNADLQRINDDLEHAQMQLLQSEKMASIGQLAAGVAHEINNPVGFVFSNLNSLKGYIDDLFGLIDEYEALESVLPAEQQAAIKAKKAAADLDFLREDIGALMGESGDGLTRVKNIVQNLKDFSHVGSSEWEIADLHAGLDSTLSIVHNEIKYKASVTKEYGTLPMVECLASELNQVFMNMLVNASHAIAERGAIIIRTGQKGEEVWVEFEDNGSGMAPETVKRIFDPFFTTKPVGKGTGLGLSLSFSIIQKHKGRIEVDSEVGRGTRFRLWLPVRHPVEETESQGGGRTG